MSRQEARWQIWWATKDTSCSACFLPMESSSLRSVPIKPSACGTPQPTPRLLCLLGITMVFCLSPSPSLLCPFFDYQVTNEELNTGVTCCAFSPNGNTLITGSSDGTIQKWMRLSSSTAWQAANVTFNGRSASFKKKSPSSPEF